MTPLKGARSDAPVKKALPGCLPEPRLKEGTVGVAVEYFRGRGY